MVIFNERYQYKQFLHGHFNLINEKHSTVTFFILVILAVPF